MKAPFSNKHKLSAFAVKPVTGHRRALLHSNIPRRTPCLGSLITPPKLPTGWCFLLCPWLKLSVGFMVDAANQIPVLPPKTEQKYWSCYYSFPSNEIGDPRKLSNGYIWTIWLKMCSTRTLFLPFLFYPIDPSSQRSVRFWPQVD